MPDVAPQSTVIGIGYSGDWTLILATKLTPSLVNIVLELHVLLFFVVALVFPLLLQKKLFIVGAVVGPVVATIIVAAVLCTVVVCLCIYKSKYNL